MTNAVSKGSRRRQLYSETPSRKHVSGGLYCQMEVRKIVDDHIPHGRLSTCPPGNSGS